MKEVWVIRHHMLDTQANVRVRSGDGQCWEPFLFMSSRCVQGPGVVGIIERQARVDFFFGGRSIPGKNEIGIVVDVLLPDLSGTTSQTNSLASVQAVCFLNDPSTFVSLDDIWSVMRHTHLVSSSSNLLRISATYLCFVTCFRQPSVMSLLF